MAVQATWDDYPVVADSGRGWDDFPSVDPGPTSVSSLDRTDPQASAAAIAQPRGPVEQAVLGGRIAASVPQRSVQRSTLGEIGAGLARGVGSVALETPGAGAEAVGSLLGIESLKQAGEAVRRAGQTFRQQIAPPSSEQGILRQTVSSISETLPEFVQQIAFGALTRSPLAASALGGGNSGVRQFAAAKDALMAQGLDEKTASWNAGIEATAIGLATVATELLPMKTILAKKPSLYGTLLQKARQVTGRMAVSGGKEGIQEAVQSIIDNFIESFGRGERGGTGSDVQAAVKALGETVADPAAQREAFVSFMAGGVLGAGGGLAVDPPATREPLGPSEFIGPRQAPEPFGPRPMEEGVYEPPVSERRARPDVDVTTRPMALLPERIVPHEIGDWRAPESLPSPIRGVDPVGFEQQDQMTPRPERPPYGLDDESAPIGLADESERPIRVEAGSEGETIGLSPEGEVTRPYGIRRRGVDPIPVESDGTVPAMRRIVDDAMVSRPGGVYAIAEMDHVPSRSEWAEHFPEMRMTREDRAEFQTAARSMIESDRAAGMEQNPEIEAEMRRRGEDVLRTGVDPDTGEVVPADVVERWRDWLATQPKRIDEPVSREEQAGRPIEADVEPDAPTPVDAEIAPESFDDTEAVAQPQMAEATEATEAESPRWQETTDEKIRRLQSEADELAARLGREASGQGPTVTMSAGVNPQVFQTAVQLGVKLLQLNFTKFGAFAQQFTKVAGQKFAQFAAPVWYAARAAVGSPVPFSKRRFTTANVLRIGGDEAHLGMIGAKFFPLLSNAYRSGHAAVIKAAQRLALGGYDMEQEIQRKINESLGWWRKVPKVMQDRFFDLMDEYHDPATIDSDPNVHAQLKEPLKAFKTIVEDMRTQIVSRRREMAEAILSNMNMADLVADAVSRGRQWTVRWVRHANRPPMKMIDTGAGLLTRQQAIDELVKVHYPDDWGRKYAHVAHLFLGRFKLGYVDAQGKHHSIGSGDQQAYARTESEAYRELRRFMEQNPNIGIDSLTIERDTSIPTDVTRISSDFLRRMVGDIADAAKVSEAQVREGLRGKIGQERFREKFYAPLRRRTGKEGYSRDFARVFSAQLVGFERWKALGDIRKDVQPMIEDLRRQGHVRWADHLEDALQTLWGDPPSAIDAGVDRFIERLYRKTGLAEAGFPQPGPGAWSKTLGVARAITFWKTLMTTRQAILNLTHPAQILFPMEGFSGMARGIRGVFTKQGRDILRKHYSSQGRSKFATDFVTTNAGRLANAANISARTDDLAQRFMFVSEFLRFKEDLGMSDAEAARNARLSALVHIGMKHSPANEPAILRSGEAKTLLQFKRFAFAQFGLGMEMLAQRKYGAVGRWFGINLLLGGLRATIGYAAGSALLASLGVGDDEDEIDDTTRQAVLHGLPTALGIDLSGSLSLIDAPPGRNWREKFVNATMGPSISTIDRVIDAVAGGQTGPEQTSAATRAGRAVVQSSPSLKQLFDLLDAIDGEPEDIVTPDGRKQYEKTTTDLWVNAFGLRSTDQTVARERVEAIAEFKAGRLAAKSAAAQARNSGDLDGMYEAIGEWNAKWPAYRITTDEVRTFARQRAEKAQQGALERAGGR